jgi:hypothetical protein
MRAAPTAPSVSPPSPVLAEFAGLLSLLERHAQLQMVLCAQVPSSVTQLVRLVLLGWVFAYPEEELARIAPAIQLAFLLLLNPTFAGMVCPVRQMVDQVRKPVKLHTLVPTALAVTHRSTARLDLRAGLCQRFAYFPPMLEMRAIPLAALMVLPTAILAITHANRRSTSNLQSMLFSHIGLA